MDAKPKQPTTAQADTADQTPMNPTLYPHYGTSSTSASGSGSVPSTSREMDEQVHAAHRNEDAAESRRLHELKIQLAMKNGGLGDEVYAGLGDHATENHTQGGDYIKSAVYGGLDGIITTFATVTSVAGSGLPHAVILILGVAHLVADGMSMGLGDMLSSQAEADLVKHERKRETWEFDNFPEGELEEMVELYEKKGISTEDARSVVATLSKYKEAFIDIMMVEELHLMPVEDDDTTPIVGGAVTFGAFMLFGIIPLLSFLVNLLPGVHMEASLVFGISCVLTVLTLFTLGAVKGSFVGQEWWKAGISMAINGSLAAFFGWIIGYLLQLTGIQNVA